MRAMRVMALGAMVASGAVGGGCLLTGPETITINGKVVDGELQPLAGLPVLVTGHAQVTTDAKGQFSVSGVEKPYDVATALRALRFVVVYTKLTRDDPALMVSVANLGTPQTHYGNVSGTVSGGTGYPHPDYHRTEVLFESPEATSSALADPMGAYQMALIDWRGSSTTTGTILALQWRFDATTLLPAEYLGYGTRTGVVLSSGRNVTWAVSALGPFAGLDGAAGSTSFFLPGDGSSGFSGDRHFTTAR